MTNDVAIRPARREDLDALHELDMECIRERATWGEAEAGPEMLAGWLGGRFLVAEAAGRVVGVAYGTARTNDGSCSAVFSPNERYFEVIWLFVRREERRRGIGGALLDRLLADARGDGLERAIVYSAARELDPVIRFYRAHGLKTWYAMMFK